MKRKFYIYLIAAFCITISPVVIQSCGPSSGTTAGDDDPNDKENKKDDPNDPNDNN